MAKIKTEVVIVGAGAAGAILAAIGRSVHQTQATAEILPVREAMESMLRLPEAGIPEAIATGVLDLIDRLPQDNRLSHGDLLAANVMRNTRGWPASTL